MIFHLAKMNVIKVASNRRYKKAEIILSLGKNLNPVRFLIKNLDKYEVISTIGDPNVFSNINIKIENILYEEALSRLKNNHNLKIISFKQGSDLQKEINEIRQQKINIPLQYITSELEQGNCVTNFNNLIETFNLNEIEKIFNYFRSQGKKICIINGNCQTIHLTTLLSSNQTFQRLYQIIDIPRICTATAADIPAIEEILKLADLIITQPIKQTNKFTETLSTEHIKQIKNNNSTLVLIPNLTFMGYFPQAKLFETDSQPLKVGDKALFTYHDTIIEYFFEQGFDRDSIYSKVMDPFLLDREFVIEYMKEQLEIFKDREKDVDIKMIDELERRVFTEVIFHSFNHPKISLIKSLAQKILKYLDIQDLNVKSPETDESLPFQSQPVYPAVFRALNINPNLESKFYINKLAWSDTFSFRGYIEMYFNALLLNRKKIHHEAN